MIAGAKRPMRTPRIASTISNSTKVTPRRRTNLARSARISLSSLYRRINVDPIDKSGHTTNLQIEQFQRPCKFVVRLGLFKSFSIVIAPNGFRLRAHKAATPIESPKHEFPHVLVWVVSIITQVIAGIQAQSPL